MNINSILSDGYEVLLHNTSDTQLLRSSNIIKYYFKHKNEGSYKNSPEWLVKTLSRITNHIVTFRVYLTPEFMCEQDKGYIADCPCESCVKNEPCHCCGMVTPFDLFSEKIGYRFSRSCRLGCHVCLECRLTRL